MFRRMGRPISIFSGGARSGRDIRYGGPIWAFAVLIGLLAVLTSPLWLFSPPEAFGTRNQFRMAGASFWIALLVTALIAGRSWGLRLVLNHADRSVSRESSGPWKTTILWTWSGDRIESVSLSTDSQGILWLQASPKEGKQFLIEKGTQREELGVLGEDLAQCREFLSSAELEYPRTESIQVTDGSGIVGAPRRDRMDHDRLNVGGQLFKHVQVARRMRR